MHTRLMLLFLRLCIEAGVRIHGMSNIDGIMPPDFVLEESKMVPPLRRLCRTEIRKRLVRIHNKDVRNLLSQLGLPKLLENDLSLVKFSELCKIEDNG